MKSQCHNLRNQGNIRTQNDITPCAFLILVWFMNRRNLKDYAKTFHSNFCLHIYLFAQWGVLIEFHFTKQIKALLRENYWCWKGNKKMYFSVSERTYHKNANVTLRVNFYHNSSFSNNIWWPLLVIKNINWINKENNMVIQCTVQQKRLMIT